MLFYEGWDSAVSFYGNKKEEVRGVSDSSTKDLYMVREWMAVVMAWESRFLEVNLISSPAFIKNSESRQGGRKNRLENVSETRTLKGN